MIGIAPPRGLKSQPEKSVCLALLVHAGIIALRYPALLSSKQSGHCVFVWRSLVCYDIADLLQGDAYLLRVLDAFYCKQPPLPNKTYSEPFDKSLCL